MFDMLHSTYSMPDFLTRTFTPFLIVESNTLLRRSLLKFRLFHTECENQTDQESFFRLLVDLFCYMASGKSHIGYLNNNPNNPYVLRSVIAPPVYLSVY
jgi:hypothetical protein